MDLLDQREKVDHPERQDHPDLKESLVRLEDLESLAKKVHQDPSGPKAKQAFLEHLDCLVSLEKEVYQDFPACLD